MFSSVSLLISGIPIVFMAPFPGHQNKRPSLATLSDACQNIASCLHDDNPSQHTIMPLCTGPCPQSHTLPCNFPLCYTLACPLISMLDASIHLGAAPAQHSLTHWVSTPVMTIQVRPCPACRSTPHSRHQQRHLTSSLKQAVGSSMQAAAEQTLAGSPQACWELAGAARSQTLTIRQAPYSA